MIIILVVLFAAAIVFASRKQHKTSAFFYVLSGLLVVAVGCGPATAYLLDSLQADYAVAREPEWGDRNTIVLLGAGANRVEATSGAEVNLFAYSRIAKSLELYNSCKSAGHFCRILVSGGDPEKHGESEASIYGARLRQLGIPNANIALEEKSRNTWENAKFTKVMLEGESAADRVFLVSSAVNLRRSLMYFAHFGVVATPIRADYLSVPFTPIPESLNFALSDVAVHEYVGIVRYHAYNALGWNTPPSGQR